MKFLDRLSKVVSVLAKVTLAVLERLRFVTAVLTNDVDEELLEAVGEAQSMFESNTWTNINTTDHD